MAILYVTSLIEDPPRCYLSQDFRVVSNPISLSEIYKAILLLVSRSQDHFNNHSISGSWYQRILQTVKVGVSRRIAETPQYIVYSSLNSIVDLPGFLTESPASARLSASPLSRSATTPRNCATSRILQTFFCSVEIQTRKVFVQFLHKETVYIPITITANPDSNPRNTHVYNSRKFDSRRETTLNSPQ